MILPETSINKNLDKFNELVEQNSNTLASLPQDTVLSLRVDALLYEKDYTGAKNYVNACSLDEEDRERALFVIAANNKSSSKNQNEKLGKELVTKYGDEVDYFNLTHLYYRHKKWGGLAHLTEKWYKKHRNILALSYRAIALYNKDKRDEAMATLQCIEEVAVLTPALRDLKIHLLIANSQFDDAIAMIDDSSFRTDNGNVALQLSSLYANMGDLENAVTVLIEFVGRHPNSIQATAYLIQHLERVNLNEAYKYAKQIASYHSDNPQILLNWMNIGFKTNHDNEVAHLLTNTNFTLRNSANPLTLCNAYDGFLG